VPKLSAPAALGSGRHLVARHTEIGGPTFSGHISIVVVEPGSSTQSKPTGTAPANPPPLPKPRRSDPKNDFAELERALGDFRIVRQIGSGAMGTVYLAEHRVIGSRVAVKLLKPSLASNPELVEQFYDEARAVNRVGHPGIVRIFDLKLVPPASYVLVMEYLEGRPLTTLTDRPVPVHAAVPILVQICNALEAAHQVGVVHRDVKSDNVFLVRRGRREMVKLLDFGAVRLQGALGSGESRRSGKIVLGTPAFMPPEQWRNEGIDGRSDVYAMGVLAFRLTTGKLPFDIRGKPPAESFKLHRDKPPPDPRSLNSGIPQKVADLILRALQKKQEDRFQTAAEMGAALRRSLGPSMKRRRRERSNGSSGVTYAPSLITTWDSGNPTRALAARVEEGSADSGGISLDEGVWKSAYQACSSSNTLTLTNGFSFTQDERGPNKATG
jgi:serine/threonine protein kinase